MTHSEKFKDLIITFTKDLDARRAKEDQYYQRSFEILDSIISKLDRFPEEVEISYFNSNRVHCLYKLKRGGYLTIEPYLNLQDPTQDRIGLFHLRGVPADWAESIEEAVFLAKKYLNE